jgi:HEPN domain-containing protein
VRVKLRSGESQRHRCFLQGRGLNANAVPKTHNLQALLDLVPQPVQVHPEVEEATILTNYAVLTRYPGAFDRVHEDRYRQLVAHAQRVVAWAEGIIAGGR